MIRHERESMRRFLFLFIVGMLLISPTACARNGSDTRNQPVTPTPPPSDNDDTYVPMNYYY
jgi:hypothetical protein